MAAVMRSLRDTLGILPHSESQPADGVDPIQPRLDHGALLMPRMVLRAVTDGADRLYLRRHDYRRVVAQVLDSVARPADGAKARGDDRGCLRNSERSEVLPRVVNQFHGGIAGSSRNGLIYVNLLD